MVSSTNSEGEVACPAKTITQMPIITLCRPILFRTEAAVWKWEGLPGKLQQSKGKGTWEWPVQEPGQSPCAMLCTVSSDSSFGWWVPTGGTKSIAKKFFSKWIPQQGFSTERTIDSVRLQKQRSTSTQGLLALCPQLCCWESHVAVQPQGRRCPQKEKRLQIREDAGENELFPW